MGFLAISIGLILAPSKVGLKLQIRYPQWDLPARIFSTTAMVLIITLPASVLGSEWSGLPSPIFGFSVTPVHIRAATGFSRMNLHDRLEAEITISRYDAAHASLRLPGNLTPYSSSSLSKAVCVLPAPPVLEWFQCP